MPGVKAVMPFDTLIMKAVTDELQVELCGAPVQRVYEPERGTIIIEFYTRGRQQGLLFSIDTQYSRIHLTEKRNQSRKQPSPFCMLLRKYLIGGRATSFSNPPLERIMEIAFEPPEGMPPVKLVAEIMGRRSNIILLNDAGIILGAARIASLDKNPKRAIMPAEQYQPAPLQNKLNPLGMEQAVFTENMQDLIAGGKTPEQALFNSVEGISPLTARELLFRSRGNSTGLHENYNLLFREIRNLFRASEKGQLQPVLLNNKNLYAAMTLKHLPPEEQQEYESVNKMLDHYYSRFMKNNREKTLRELLKGSVERRLAALDKKREKQENELQSAQKAPEHRLYGELLLAYGHLVPRGAKSAVLPDLYNQGKEVIVPLDPSISVGANAQKHFNRYQKAKKGQDQIRKQLRKTRLEIKYCEELLYTIENNTEAALDEIRQEMAEAGFIRDKQKSQRKSASFVQPLSFTTSSGRSVLVGRNNRQNDYVTFKAAVRRDTWFHVQKLPGSHVILKEAPYPPPPDDIAEAAFLAAYFSRGRESGALAVDYTEVRHVRRRPGGKPGFVFYENYETITVNPLDEAMRKKFGLLS